MGCCTAGAPLGRRGQTSEVEKEPERGGVRETDERVRTRRDRHGSTVRTDDGAQPLSHWLRRRQSRRGVLE